MKAKGQRQQKGGDRKSKRHEDALIQPPKLSGLGMSTKEASNWQLLAEACSGDNPEAVLDQLCEEIEEETVELTGKVIKRALLEAPIRTAKQQKISGEALSRKHRTLCPMCATFQTLRNSVNPSPLLVMYASIFLAAVSDSIVLAISSLLEQVLQRSH
jgi:hypothetical protein